MLSDSGGQQCGHRTGRYWGCYVRLAVTVLALGGLTTGWADDETPPPYEEVFTAERGGVFGYDIHAWLYTPAFAEEFQMPARWASGELQGVRDLAYRVKWHTGMKCGFEDSPHYRRRVRCVLDAYWDRGTDLPFRKDLGVNQDSFSGDSSMHWLSPQTRADFEQIQQIRRSNTLAEAALVAYTDTRGDGQYQEINTFQYERRMYELEYVSFQLPCSVPEHLERGSGPVRLYIGESGVSNGALREAVQAGGDDAHINRAITVPASFHQRWQQHHVEYMGWEPAYHDTYRVGGWGPKGDFVAKGYEAGFTEKAEGLYDRDVHIWTYTEEFAERFGMPAQWIAEEDLGDAAALAFRVQRDVQGLCGAGYDQEKCNRSEHCMWDVYFPDEAELPWYVDWPVANTGRNDRSLIYLQARSPRLYREPGEVYQLSQYI